MPAKIIVDKEYVDKLYRQFCTRKIGVNTLAKQEGLSSHTIQKWFDEYNYVTKPNHDYFNQIDDEFKAYYLGLLYADGCVSNLNDIRQPQLSIALKQSDGYVLNDLNRFIKPYSPLIHVQRKGKNTQDQIIFSIRSTQLCNSLIKHGVLPNKSKENKEELRLPNLNYNLLRHFVRGFFDGDGSIFQPMLRKNTRNVEFYSTSESFIKDLLDLLKVGNYYKREAKNKQPIFRYTINKQDDVLFLRKFMYEPSSICIERKKERFYGLAVPLRWPFICPACNSQHFKKNGKRNNKIRLICKDCETHYTY